MVLESRWQDAHRANELQTCPVNWGMVESWRERQERGLLGRQQAQPFPSCQYQGPSSRTVTTALNACPICHRGKQQAGFSHQAGLGLIFPSSWFSAAMALSLHGKGRPNHLWASCSGTGHMEQKLLPLVSCRMETGHFLPASTLEPGVPPHNHLVVPRQGPGSGQMVGPVWRKGTRALDPDTCSIF